VAEVALEILHGGVYTWNGQRCLWNGAESAAKKRLLNRLSQPRPETCIARRGP
jgi:hypothetical protein